MSIDDDHPLKVAEYHQSNWFGVKPEPAYVNHGAIHAYGYDGSNMFLCEVELDENLYEWWPFISPEQSAESFCKECVNRIRQATQRL